MYKHEILVVIPARGGSVRVFKKNIKPLCGLPLLAYAIKAAKEVKGINRIIVSTDDEEIKKVALQYGAEVPFKRPPRYCGDCPTEDVVLHAIRWLAIKESYHPNIVFCLEPPLPFRTAHHIEMCLKEFYDTSVDSVVTISPISQRPEWMVRINGDCMIHPYTNYFEGHNAPEKPLMRFPASQEFEPLYYVNGLVFACRVKVLKKWKSLVGRDCVGVVTDKDDSFSLDWPIDFDICEMLMKERG